MHAQREGEVIHAESNYVVTRTGQGALLLYLHHLILLLVRSTGSLARGFGGARPELIFVVVAVFGH